MRKVIAAFNMTLDSICDHTAGIADEELHHHYKELIDHSGVILYGRITFELMQFWPTLLQSPSGERSMDEFAVSIDKIPKLVFSNKLVETNWDSAQISDKPLIQKMQELKEQTGKDILIGSRSLIIQLLNQELVDQLQICIHPVIEGKGLLLFDQIREQVALKFIRLKTLGSGAIVFYYEPQKNE